MPKHDMNEIIGKTYNRLTIVDDLGIPYIGFARKVIAYCKCGTINEYFLASIVAGTTKSCGCLKIERGKIWKKKHGLSHHPIHKLWITVKQRCYNPNNTNYKTYGAVGVIMCSKWKNSFKIFYNWCIKNGWQKGLQLDKDLLSPLELGKIYCPKYCSFVTAKQNLLKTSLSHFVIYKDINKTLMEWSIELNLNYSAVNKRLARGWDTKKAFETPIALKNITHA